MSEQVFRSYRLIAQSARAAELIRRYFDDGDESAERSLWLLLNEISANATSIREAILTTERRNDLF
jgi:hypothetical protein